MNMDKGDTQLIIGVCVEHGLLRNQTAYVLANTYWETGHTMLPVEEAFWVHPNDPVKMDRWRKSNLRYYPHHGRGHTQITWLRNYEKVKTETGMDVVSNPEMLLTDSYLSATAMVVGMIEGWFTGKKLSDYITLKKSNYVGARRIINGTDKAHAIAELAREYEAQLLADGYGVEEPVAPIVNDRRDGSAPRGNPMQSTTNLSVMGTGITFLISLSEQAKGLVGTVTDTFGVSPNVAFAAVILAGLGWIFRERLKKWADGDR
jgi:hypothetical protein